MQWPLLEEIYRWEWSIMEKETLKCKLCRFTAEFDNVDKEQASQEQIREAFMEGKKLQDHVAFRHPRQWALFLQKNFKWLKKNPNVYNDAFYEKFVEEI